MCAAALLGFVRFETPGYLALLAVLPLLVALSFRSLAALGRVRRVLAIVMRCAVVSAAVLALAGAQRTLRIDDLCVIFLLDRSRSVPGDLQREAFQFVQRAAEGRRRDDRLGIVGFDGAADVEQLPQRELIAEGLHEPFNPDQTDIAAAARLALALLPANTIGRVVLISDGNENAGAVLQEAQQFKAAGVPIDVLPVQYTHTHEVVLESLKAPPTANVDETINLHVVLRSQRATTGRLLLWHNEEQVDLNGAAPGAGLAIELQAGPNRRVLQLPLRYAGAHRFTARFEPDSSTEDTLPDNNEGRAFTVVAGQGKILILTTREDLDRPQPSALILERALEAERLVCDVAIAGDEPLDQVRLLEYSLVVLSNVPAGDIREDEKQTLATYVRELGGGLVMVGGDNSFGAGGWMGSPVEEVMPVSFDVKHKKQFIRGALALVMHACEIERGNYLGERCAIEAVQALSSRDLVGVLAWAWQGGQQGHWVVPMQEVGTKTPIINAIKKMSMGDMPYLEDVMRPAAEALIAKNRDGPKHMIVVSDFDPQPPSDATIKKMKDAGITCSTVAIGYGSHFINETLAKQIADATGGRFYRTNDFSKLPQIFVKESREVRRSLVQEGVFTPRLVNPLSPVVPGLTDGGLPNLGGFVLTTARELADTPIVRKSEEGDDPILAHWQVGLGKTVAFTSGLWPQWGPEWTAWPRFSKFWAQTIRWASRQAESAAFDVSTSVRGGKATLRIDALDKNAEAINFMELAGTLVQPNNAAQSLRLTQTGPGRYEGEFDVRDRGNYIVNLAYRMGRGPEAVSGTLRTGLSMAYSAEYAQLTANLPLLEEVRNLTGGRLLDAQQAAQVFDRAGLPRAEDRRSIWETLVSWMLVLFLADVAVRRIAVNPVELYRKVRSFIRDLAGRGRPQEAAAVLSTLKGARERIRESQVQPGPKAGEAAERPPAAATRYEAPEATKAADDLSRALGGATSQDRPVVAQPPARKGPQSEADYLARLLRAKKRAREDVDKADEGPGGPAA